MESALGAGQAGAVASRVRRWPVDGAETVAAEGGGHAKTENCVVSLVRINKSTRLRISETTKADN